MKLSRESTGTVRFAGCFYEKTFFPLSLFCEIYLISSGLFASIHVRPGELFGERRVSTSREVSELRLRFRNGMPRQLLHLPGEAQSDRCRAMTPVWE